MVPVKMKSKMAIFTIKVIRSRSSEKFSLVNMHAIQLSISCGSIVMAKVKFLPQSPRQMGQKQDAP